MCCISEWLNNTALLLLVVGIGHIFKIVDQHRPMTDHR